MRAGIKCLKCGKMISHDAYDLYSTHDGIKPPEHTISVPCPHCQSQIECLAVVRHLNDPEKPGSELTWTDRYLLAWALSLLDTNLKDSMTGEGDEILADFRAKIRGVKTKLNLK
jgi:DNA-directed RNA polymerase subunit RPC12/RpoP